MTTTAPEGRSFGQLLIAAWALLGVLALLGKAIVQLTPLAVDALGSPAMTWWHWAIAAAWTVWMAYAEGYRGFQHSFSPRTAARAIRLADDPPAWWHVMLAPAFAMGLFHAGRRTLIVVWSISLMVIGLVLLVGLLEQPWRGIVDLGVVVGLAWGSLTLVVQFVRGLRDASTLGDPDLPRGR